MFFLFRPGGEKISGPYSRVPPGFQQATCAPGCMGLKHAKDVGLLAGNQQMLGVTKVDVGNDVLREENAANWFDMITN